MGALMARLEDRVGGRDLDLAATALAVSRIPYGRPRHPGPGGVLDEWIGTCSTKHVLFAALVEESWPELRPRLWHRPYRVSAELAREHWGVRVAEQVPRRGLVDVHTFATLEIDGRTVRVDVTFPLHAWDGRSDIALACGAGRDHPGGVDPLATKARLVTEHCDPAVREPFIAALAAAIATKSR